MRNLIAFILLVSLSGFIGCTELSNDPYYRTPYDDPYYGGGGYDDYERRREYERARREREELEDERERLEEERERLEREREREEQREKNEHRRPPPPPPPPAPPKQERCPPGFSPNNSGCTDKERRKGCQDIRLDSGQGCVKR